MAILMRMELMHGQAVKNIKELGMMVYQMEEVYYGILTIPNLRVISLMG